MQYLTVTQTTFLIDYIPSSPAGKLQHTVCVLYVGAAKQLYEGSLFIVGVVNSAK